MGSGDTLCIWNAQEGAPSLTAYAQLDTRNGHPVVAFDTGSPESFIYNGLLPRNYAGGGTTVYLTWCAASATTGTIGWLVSWERIGAAQQDIDSDGFASANTLTAVTVDATSGNTSVGNVTFTNGAQMDSVAVGEAFRLKISRDTTNDTALGDAQLLRVEIKET